VLEPAAALRLAAQSTSERRLIAAGKDGLRSGATAIVLPTTSFVHIAVVVGCAFTLMKNG
jgi:hypothetical protein